MTGVGAPYLPFRQPELEKIPTAPNVNPTLLVPMMDTQCAKNDKMKRNALRDWNNFRNRSLSAIVRFFVETGSKSII